MIRDCWGRFLDYRIEDLTPDPGPVGERYRKQKGVRILLRRLGDPSYVLFIQLPHTEFTSDCEQYMIVDNRSLQRVRYLGNPKLLFICGSMASLCDFSAVWLARCLYNTHLSITCLSCPLEAKSYIEPDTLVHIVKHSGPPLTAEI